MAFHRFIRAALEKRSVPLFGDGQQSRDFTFIEDIVEANLLAALKGQPGAVFNVGGGVQATVNEVLSIISTQLGQVSLERSERQAGDARHTSADTSLIREALGFVPKVSLDVGIEREIQWMRDVLAQEAATL
jgi:UDP-glucose 4-epimerase